MTDARHLRFADISGIRRIDLPIAVEIWLHDIATSNWANCDVIKLATLFSQYIQQPRPEVLNFATLESGTGLKREHAIEAAMVLRSFGAVHDFDCGGPRLKSTLNLTFLQRLRVLEVCSRFAELRTELRDQELPWHASELSWANTDIEGHAAEEGAAQTRMDAA